MNIDISEINKNTLKFIEIFCKSVKMTLIIYCDAFVIFHTKIQNKSMQLRAFQEIKVFSN